ncbi:MAG TPA: glycosyltransferase, partial [Acidimicrobiales bacterium]|nr:glycosyltransferase [Acidimicrobiales bacterium]
CHDVWLGNLYLAEHGDLPSEYRSLPRAVRNIYGPLMTDEFGIGNIFSDEQRRRCGVLLVREVIEASEGFLVSSRAAADLARADIPGRYAERVGILPFALEAPPSASGPPAGARGGPGQPGGPPARGGQAGILAELGAAPLVAHFGIVDPAKQPFLLIDAFARVRREVPAARLAFVGPCAESLAEDLRSRAGEHELGDSFLLTGEVPAAVYRALVERATVAVQLRSRFNGEASAAAGQCLACGVATIVSDLGWMGELPDQAVVKVPGDVSPDVLGRHILDLLADPERRATLSGGARQLAARQGFDVAARALLEAIEELRGAA